MCVVFGIVGNRITVTVRDQDKLVMNEIDDYHKPRMEQIMVKR